MSTAAKVFRREKNRGETLPCRFEDWIERERERVRYKKTNDL